GRDELVHAAPERREELVAERETLRQPLCDPQRVPRDARHTAEQDGASCGQPARVAVVATVGGRGGWIARQTRRRRGEPVDRLVRHTRVEEPVDELATAVAPGKPRA